MPTDLAPFSLERFMGAAMAMARGGMLPGPSGINLKAAMKS